MRLMAGTDTGGRAPGSTPCCEPSCRQAFLTRTWPNPAAARHLRPNNQHTGTQPCPSGDVLTSGRTTNTREHSPARRETCCSKSAQSHCRPLHTTLDTALPTRGTRPSSSHQRAGTRPPHRGLHTPRDQPRPRGRWQKQARQPAARSETTLTESQTRWDGEDYVPEEGTR